MTTGRSLDELIEHTPDMPWLSRAACGELDLDQLDLFFVEAGRTISSATVSLQIRRQGRVVTYLDQRTNPNVLLGGGDEHFVTSRNFEVAAGRNLGPDDVEFGRPVVVLGADVAEKIFVNEEPVGRLVFKHKSGELPQTSGCDEREKGEKRVHTPKYAPQHHCAEYNTCYCALNHNLPLFYGLILACRHAMPQFGKGLFIFLQMFLVAVVLFYIPFSLFIFEEKERKYIVVAVQGFTHNPEPQVVHLQGIPVVG